MAETQLILKPVGPPPDINISRLAKLSGLSRTTVRRRLKDAAVVLMLVLEEFGITFVLAGLTILALAVAARIGNSRGAAQITRVRLEK